MIDLDQNYTVKQVADIWGSSTGTVYNEINDSRLKSKKIRKSRRITGRDLREYAEVSRSQAGRTVSEESSRKRWSSSASTRHEYALPHHRSG
jgi:excisionase family DNA binding protein